MWESWPIPLSQGCNRSLVSWLARGREKNSANFLISHCNAVGCQKGLCQRDMEKPRMPEMPSICLLLILFFRAFHSQSIPVPFSFICPLCRRTPFSVLRLEILVERIKNNYAYAAGKFADLQTYICTHGQMGTTYIIYKYKYMYMEERMEKEVAMGGRKATSKNILKLNRNAKL